MRVLVLIDSAFAVREHSMLERLEIGLASEGVQVLHAVPDSAGHWGESGIFARAIRYPQPGLVSTRRTRLRSLQRELAGVLGEDKLGSVDVVHAFGGQLWTLACDLARSIDAVAALEVWRGGLVERALALAGATRQAEHGPVFFAPDQATCDGLHARGLGPATKLVGWGVHARAAPSPILPTTRPPAVMLFATGRDARACTMAVEAIATRVREQPETLVFVSAEAAERAALWPLAHRLGILSAVSLIEGMEVERELVTRGDVLVYPEAIGEHRTVLLESMGAGMAVVAAGDPMVDAIVHDRTAKVVAPPSRQGFEEALAGVLDDHDEARRLGASAWDDIRQHRRASAQVGSVIDAYEWMCSKDAVPIRDPGPGGGVR